MRLILVGLVLSIIIFLPRIIPIVTGKTSTASTVAQSAETTQVAKTDIVAGSSSEVSGSSQAISGSQATSGSQAASDSQTPNGSQAISGSQTANSKVIQSEQGTSSGNSSAAIREEALSQEGGNELVKLKSRITALETQVEMQQVAYKEFTVMVKKKFALLVMDRQISNFKVASSNGLFKVPAWSVPWCHKAELNSDDLKGFYKLGVGMVRPVDDKQPKEVILPLKGMFLFYLNKMKLSGLRLYRESMEHTGKLGDMVSPDDRAEKAPLGLPVSSVNLNGTLQCIYSIDSSGKLKMKGVLYSIPRGELIHKVMKSGMNYEQVVKSMAKEFAGLSQKLTEQVAQGE
jgi:hypothetical protein